MLMIGMRMLMGAVFTGVIVALAGCVPTMGVMVRMTVRMRVFIDFRKFHGAASLDADPGSSRYCRGSRVRTQPPDRPAG